MIVLIKTVIKQGCKYLLEVYVSQIDFKLCNTRDGGKVSVVPHCISRPSTPWYPGSHSKIHRFKVLMDGLKSELQQAAGAYGLLSKAIFQKQGVEIPESLAPVDTCTVFA